MNEGILLVDILLAVSLTTLFIVIMTESFSISRNTFERAKERNKLLYAFESNNSELITSTVRKFGNDMMETDMTVSSGKQSISFTKINSLPFNDMNASAGTALCSVDFIGNYTFSSSTVLITPIILPVNPLLPLTDIEVRNGIAYVSSDSSTASDSDLFVININNSISPTLISSINTGPGISTISLAGQRIFAAVASTAGQLHIIRFDGLDNPVLEKKYKLPPPYATATQPLASSIFYNMSKIYLGTEKWDGQELSIIDISNPLQPNKIGGFETGSKINDIFVNGGIIYIAGSDENQFQTISIVDPTSPSHIESFNPSGWQRQTGKFVSLFEDDFFLGRTSGGFNIANDHELFSGFNNLNSIDIAGGVYGIVTDRKYIYLATRELNKEFQILDKNLALSTAFYFSLPVAPQAMTCDHNKLFILAATAPVIYEISFKK